MIAVGDRVRFTAPYPDEVGLTYRVVELRGPRILVAAICDLPYPPTQSVLAVDIEKVPVDEGNGFV